MTAELPTAAIELCIKQCGYEFLKIDTEPVVATKQLQALIADREHLQNQITELEDEVKKHRRNNTDRAINALIDGGLS